LRCADESRCVDELLGDGLGRVFVAVFPGFLYCFDILAIAMTSEHLCIIDSHPADIEGERSGCR
jgi:hypothetical protein